MKTKFYCINLDNRTDRWERISKHYKNNTTFEVERYSAINGYNLKATPKLLKLFQEPFKKFKNGQIDWGIRSGVVGCALSHVSLWIKVLYGDEDYAIVTEDDGILEPHFDKKLDMLLKNVSKDWELIFLGLHPTNKTKDEYYSKSYNSICIKNMATNYDNENYIDYIGGTFGYIINKNFCKKILKYFNETTIGGGIDSRMCQMSPINVVNIYYITPCIIRSCLDGENLVIDNIPYKTNGNIQGNGIMLNDMNKYTIEDVEKENSPLYDGEKYTLENVIKYK